jgi:hypothetical protein
MASSNASAVALEVNEVLAQMLLSVCFFWPVGFADAKRLRFPEPWFGWFVD